MPIDYSHKVDIALRAASKRPLRLDEMAQRVGFVSRSSTFRNLFIERGGTHLLLKHGYHFKFYPRVYCWDIDGRYEEYRSRILPVCARFTEPFGAHQIAERIGESNLPLVKRYLINISEEYAPLVVELGWRTGKYLSANKIRSLTHIPMTRPDLRKKIDKYALGHLVSNCIKRGFLKKEWGKVVWVGKQGCLDDYPIL